MMRDQLADLDEQALQLEIVRSMRRALRRWTARSLCSTHVSEWNRARNRSHR